jgi:hypothetical protein
LHDDGQAEGQGAKISTVSDQGLSLSFFEGYDIINRRYVKRLDAMWAVDLIDPRLAGRLTS